ncbi:autotransporter outer membrane beta-barrel domain-containing protein [Variovorax dokdonensis]|uniref:Autotransporter outer membrane beta-barrel domain-containing protein n=1 Tax=Variovorax dokdonensis TaxID=344883 RepID=A0ABT7N7M3_9BURK|nr:autotransporter outer membrane beta-barrel domain-containing protein [Variovorax dokdonensis]MDM0043948.1 autotransporter outer membrane beta-barrel domain-containing protein [Variovorax dokdonensis]
MLAAIRGDRTHAARCLAAAAGVVAVTHAGLAAAQAARPETGALMGAQRQSDLIFIHGLDDRYGGLGFTSPTNGEGWLRLDGGGMKSSSNNARFEADSSTWLLQGGVALPVPRSWSHWRLGALASYGSASTDGTAAGNPYTAKGQADGYGLGLTATWRQDPTSRLGWYGDLWWQYGWFDNSVSPPGLATNDYKSHVGLASGEAGYSFALTPGWLLTPQAQWVYVHNHAYTFIESDGTQVESAHRGGWTSRLGVRLQRTSDPDQRGLRLSPYAAANWWHDAYLGDEVIYNGSQSIKDLYPNDRFELKGGLSIGVGNKWSAWGDVGWQTGNQSFQAWTARVGARYAW